ncbi:MAG: hypothetical protein Q8N09_02820 [Thermodesulfovibrionia bacterium]|nr:hypothetical protein [Thermodesulfovibrionia bacterium]
MTARRLKKDKRWAFKKFCILSYIVMSFFTLVWLRNEVVSLEKEIGHMESKKTKLVRVAALASAERANMYSVGKIEEVAMKQLGMNVPNRERIFTVKKTTGAAPYKASVEAASELNRAEPAISLSNPKVLKKDKSDKRRR